ncbi:MAG: DUF2834 domain-containing protein [Gemmatimonadaceae bacterium]|nr:DUF2834 domain-containing protein [Gemmatimonadaceae bacterium]
MQRILLMVVFAAFAALSGVALSRHGFWGIIAPHFQSFGAGQVFADLVIALSLNVFWMSRELRRSGQRLWPWVCLTLVTGSFGPLLYLLRRDRRTPRVELGAHAGTTAPSGA